MMPLYSVDVWAIGEGQPESHLGCWDGEAKNGKLARQKALDELWDERLTAASCQPRFDLRQIKPKVAADPAADARYAHGEWEHIFSDGRQRTVRLVFDCDANQIVAMQLANGYRHGQERWVNAKEVAVADVEDSLKNANSEALEPGSGEFEFSAVPPEWARERILGAATDGTSGQDRDSYGDDQDRDSYSVNKSAGVTPKTLRYTVQIEVDDHGQCRQGDIGEGINEAITRAVEDARLLGRLDSTTIIKQVTVSSAEEPEIGARQGPRPR